MNSNTVIASPCTRTVDPLGRRYGSVGLAMILGAFGAVGQDPAWATPPRLVVGIVVDQMRVDYIHRYWDNFGDGGFKRLVREGSFQRDAHYNYIPTYTGPGHASIWTGATPAAHGIVSNDRFDRELKRSVYCAEDPKAAGVGTASDGGKRSPVQLLATTLCDELELRTDRKAKTIAVSLKDRSAIMPAGRTSDGAYWFIGGKEGVFVTSSWYRSALPQWVTDFNAQRLPERYLAQRWEPILPRERYHTPLPDDNPYEIPLVEGLRPTLPVSLDSLRKAGQGFSLLTYTPWGNTLTTDMALAALKGEDMGTDAITDLLSVSYSSPDILGHRVGPRAIEEEDLYIRLDAELARLLNELDGRVGTGLYTVFLTADHGAVDVPAYLRDLKASAGYFRTDTLKAWLEVAADPMPPLVSTWRPIIDTIYDGNVFLHRHARTPEMAERVAAALRRHPFVASALVLNGPVAADDVYGLQTLLRNGAQTTRSGDVLFTFRPGFFEYEGGLGERGTTHGSGWNYDTHVPVIFFGQGVVPGEVLRRTSITDIAPTVSALVGMALPNAASGRVVPEVVSTARPTPAKPR
jgi:predicted AlkP superfamily pyrophosphatase or phosphodiesterase